MKDWLAAFVMTGCVIFIEMHLWGCDAEVFFSPHWRRGDLHRVA